MVTGRAPGRPNLKFEQIDLILKMSEEKNHTRPEIAKTVGCAENSVYSYQKKFGYI